jgi:hypothetical protein
MSSSHTENATNCGSAAAVGEGREITPSDTERCSKVSTAPTSRGSTGNDPVLRPGAWVSIPAGLSKRELFAAMAMQGFIASGWNDSKRDTAKLSVEAADNLLAALDIRPDEQTNERTAP